ncbi:lantibiotic dehydratase [Streptomyces katsurahamanus]|uniref:Lantibiotic dehydratase n=1 Tax=Streptomyces katsurahamanus TaxID=2577098 RepID=A0ABW9NS69_9ACTN|nr:lantibiotic dehydratase [Streptomyces katsurahamanus]MQS36157.1 lantibiotic dehydratase [Streptomyces katsurahamanus]
MTTRQSVSYRWQNSALLRVTTDPGGLDLPRDLDLSGADAAARGREWLTAVWQREEIRVAVSAASPALGERIGEMVSGQRCDTRRVRRAALSLASYLLRWQGRPTPFGLFAGVAPVRIGGVPQVLWGGKHSMVVRADSAWLAGIIARLHRCPQLLERLYVVAANTGQVRGSRWVAPGLPTDDHAQFLAPIEVSVRHTGPVAAALACAASPIRYGELGALLGERFPAAPRGRIDAMLSGLISEDILITNLRAPMTELDTLGHLCTELESLDARSIPAIEDVVSELFAVRAEIAGSNAGGAASAKRMRALSNTALVPLTVDTAVDCEVQIPESVVRDAQEAVGVLCRLSPYPFGYPAWRDYHGRFRARYGTGAVVPVLDLVADSGLGFPAGYLSSPYKSPGRQLAERDEKLLRLVQQATLDGSGEIVLTEPVIADLAADAADMVPVPRIEVAVEIRAATPAALARGSYQLAVTGTPRPGSSMAGRFAHLLPSQDQARLAAAYRAASPDALATQLSFVPRRRRNENIARAMQLLPHVISLSEHQPRDEAVIEPADLAVMADAQGFHLVQLSTGRPVEPRVLHALEAGVHTPPLARFLAEINNARSAVYKSFDFGAAAHLPYLPRVRYRRTLLAPARWLLTAQELPGRASSSDAWETTFAEWRARLRVPEHITMVEHDQRLPLDLTHPVHLLLLRTRLNRSRRMELREAPGPQDFGWLGRAHEFLLSLALPEPARREIPNPIRTVDPGTDHLPGHSTVLHARIQAHPDRFDEILTEHLPALISSFETHPQWWFSRHRATPRPDSDQQLALCLSLPDPGAYGSTAERVHHWSQRLRRRRLLAQLTLAGYHPPTGRYGDSVAMEAAHAVFAADSAAAVAQIHAALSGMDGHALAVASLVDLATRFAPTVEGGLHWLSQELPQEKGPLDRTLRDRALSLADPYDDAFSSSPGAAAVAAAWQQRAIVLSAYREELSAQRDPLTALGSLLHLHHVRALGIDADRERVTGRLARACALRHIARRPR